MATVVGGGWKPQDIASDPGGCLDVGASPAEIILSMLLDQRGT